MNYRQRLSKLENTRTQLKKEFVGINKQIDLILNSIKSWYILPHLRMRPTVVNLWGITGTYKTSVIRRLVSLLELTDEFTEVDARKLNRDGFVDAALSSSAFYGDNDSSESFVQPKVFLIDEFQNAKTIDIEGEDKDSTELVDFFSLLSDGKIVRKTNAYILMSAQNLKREIGNREIILEKIENEQLRYYNEVMNNHQQVLNREETKEKDRERIEEAARSSPIKALFRLYQSDLENIKLANYYYKDIPINEFLDLIMKKVGELGHERVVDFRDILMFIVGNLDGIFGPLTYALDTDTVTPDEYYEMTKRVTINHAKMALFHKFKPEQVSRLGANHVIFPSFNSEMYMKLIDKLNENMFKEIKSSGVKVSIDNKVNNLVYQLGATPSQGARNIISTHEAIIKMAMSEAVTIGVIKKQKNVKITLDEDRNILIKYGNKKKMIPNLLIDVELDKEKIAGPFSTRVHEAGHAIVYVAVHGIYPDKVTVIEGDGYGGYMRPNKKQKIENTDKQFFVNQIAISMAGRIAEEMYCGQEGSNAGAQGDIEQASKLANLAIKMYGIGDVHDSRSGYDNMLYHPDNLMRFPLDGSDTEEAENLFKEGTLLAVDILTFYRKEHLKLTRLLERKPELYEEQLMKYLAL